MKGRPIILLDNANDRKQLRSSSLASELTSVRWTDRKLGEPIMASVPNHAVWLISGCPARQYPNGSNPGGSGETDCFQQRLRMENQLENRLFGEPTLAESCFRSDPVDPLNPRPSVEISVKAQNRSNTVVLHDRNVRGVPGRQERTILGDLPRTQDYGFLNGNHLVDDVQGNVERRSDGFAPVNSRVTVENLLQYLSISDETLPRSDQALQDNLGLCLVRMCGSDQVHRDVGIDEDQLW